MSDLESLKSEIKGLRGDVKEVMQDSSDIKRILGGDFRTGKSGLVQSTDNLLTEVYDKKTGLLKRMGNLEAAKWKTAFVISAVVLVVSIGWKVFIDLATIHLK